MCFPHSTTTLHHDPQLATHNPQLDHEAGNTSSLGEGAVIRIDGSMHSGSGTLLRYAATLATLTREPLHMVRIRAKRPKPGLRPQHLQALRSCCQFCSGRLEGDEVARRDVQGDDPVAFPARSGEGQDRQLGVDFQRAFH